MVVPACKSWRAQQTNQASSDVFRKPRRLGEPHLTLSRALEEHNQKARFNAGALGLNNFDRWDADLDLGTIQFTHTGGRVITAPVQVIGSFDSLDSTWLWSWDNPSIAEPLTHSARLAYDFGVRHDLTAYTIPQFECTQAQAWEFTALALHLSGGVGDYRGPSGTTFVFMTFGDVVVQRVN